MNARGFDSLYNVDNTTEMNINSMHPGCTHFP